MDDLFEKYPNQQTFDTFFHMKYKPVDYDDVKEAMEGLVNEAGLDIFHKDYVENKKVSKKDFKQYLSQAAKFQFEDAMTEAFYDKNPEIYETAFGMFELDAARSKSITITFHKTYQESYEAMLDELFDHLIAGLAG